jgi:hypothetical protein
MKKVGAFWYELSSEEK